MKELVVATRNPGKLQEIRQLLADTVDKVRSIIDFPEVAKVVEDGTTFTENAIKKARQTALELRLPVLADDSGLVVDALGGRPGIFSARFAGAEASDEENNNKLLAELSDTPTDARAA